MKGSNTIFQADRNMLAALTGAGEPNPCTPTYAATMSIDPAAGLLQSIDATGDATLNALDGGLPGQVLVINFKANGGTRTATFGTNFRETGTAAPTVGKSIVVAFISDGTSWLEFSRSVAVV